MLSTFRKTFRLPFILILLAFSSAAPAQLPAHFTPSPYSIPNKADSLRLSIQTKRLKDAIPATLSKDEKKEISEAYEQLEKMFTGWQDYGGLLDSSYLNVYADRILNTILKSNPDLPQDIKCYISRNAEVNAFTAGNHSMVLNLGFLSTALRESNIAFVMCHELAHEKHLDTQHSAVEGAKKSKENKAKIKEINRIAKSEYGVQNKIKALLLPDLLKEREFSREVETAADTAGLSYFINAGYNAQDAVGAIDVLDSANASKMKFDLNLRSYFTFPDIPLPSSCFREYEGSLLGTFTTVEDSSDKALFESLKSHPNNDVRRKTLQEIVKGRTASGFHCIMPEDSFALMHYHATMEEIMLQYISGNIDYTIFQTLARLREKPGDVFLRAMLSHCMSLCALKKRERKLHMYVALPSPHYNTNMNRLLVFLDDLSSDDCSALAYAMVRPENDSLMQYEIYTAALTQSALVMKKDEEFKKLYKSYSEKFSEARFDEYIYPYKPLEEKSKKQTKK